MYIVLTCLNTLASYRTAKAQDVYRGSSLGGRGWYMLFVHHPLGKVLYVCFLDGSFFFINFIERFRYHIDWKYDLQQNFPLLSTN